MSQAFLPDPGNVAPFPVLRACILLLRSTWQRFWLPCVLLGAGLSSIAVLVPFPFELLEGSGASPQPLSEAERDALLRGLGGQALISGLLAPFAGVYTSMIAYDALKGGSYKPGIYAQVMMRHLALLLLVQIAILLAVSLGFMMLILPGILASYFLMYAPLSALLSQPGVGAALRYSYHLVKGQFLALLAAAILLYLPTYFTLSFIGQTLAMAGSLGQLLALTLLNAGLLMVGGAYIAVTFDQRERSLRLASA